MYITEHFSYEELTASEEAVRLGIFNEVPDDLWGNIYRLAENLEAVRRLLNNNAMIITSGYRCPQLNEAIRGAKKSDHMDANAADFICPRYGTPYQIVETLSHHLDSFHQIIHEFGRWVHIAFRGDEDKNEVLTAVRNPVTGKTEYHKGNLRVTPNGVLLPSESSQ